MGAKAMHRADVSARSSSRWRARWLPWALLAVAAVGLCVHAVAYDFICDDAYIAFRYSWNFAYHNDLSFNLGERVEGYTNFLWVVLLGLLLKIGLLPDLPWDRFHGPATAERTATSQDLLRATVQPLGAARTHRPPRAETRV